MIIINKPYVVQNDNKSRCLCDISVDGDIRQVWFEVDKQYEQYLVTERADAYIIGLLHWCMLNGHDIRCEVPVTEELLYNISDVLIPIICKYSKALKSIEIVAETAPALIGGEAIGTGCSCGVDSFDTIYRHYNSRYTEMNITHLCINNVGAFNECYKEYGMEKVKTERYQKVDEVANELKLPIIKTDSNFYQAFPQSHYMTCTYSSCFAIYSLQKLWKYYYFSSNGIDLADGFLLNDVDDFPSEQFDLLLLQYFSTCSLRIFCDGVEKNRFEKTKNISDYPMANKYLHVCLTKPYNCGTCSKCKRTLLTLDLLGKLDNFREVFDVDYYKGHRNEYYKWLAYQHSCGDIMNEPVYQGLLKREDFNKIAKIEKIKNPLRRIKRRVFK